MRQRSRKTYFRMFSTKRRELKIGERDGHGNSRNGHGKVMGKYFVKSVGTLSWSPVCFFSRPWPIRNVLVIHRNTLLI